MWLIIVAGAAGCAGGPLLSESSQGTRLIRQRGGEAEFFDSKLGDDVHIRAINLTSLRLIPEDGNPGKFVLWGKGRSQVHTYNASLLNRFPKIEELDAIGVRWRYDCASLDLPRVRRISLARGDVPLAMLQQLFLLPQLQEIDISCLSLSSETIDTLKAGPVLRTVRLDGVDVSPQSVIALVDRCKLERVYFRNKLDSEKRMALTEASHGIIVTELHVGDGRLY